MSHVLHQGAKEGGGGGIPVVKFACAAVSTEVIPTLAISCVCFKIQL